MTPSEFIKLGEFLQEIETVCCKHKIILKVDLHGVLRPEFLDADKLVTITFDEADLGIQYGI